MLEKLKLYNEPFWQNYSCGDEKNPEVFSFVEKGSFVCLSAPHSTQTFTNKHVKKSDLFTGAITKYVAEENQFSYIVRNKFVPKKVLISDFIVENHLEKHFFLDIHAMVDGNGFDLAVGTGYVSVRQYEAQLQIIDELCRKYNLTYRVNHPNYTGCAGLVGRLQKNTGMANAIQLEWSRKYRDIFQNFGNVCHVTVPFLTALAININARQNENLLVV